MTEDFIPAYVISTGTLPKNLGGLQFVPEVLAYVPFYKTNVILTMDLPTLSDPHDRLKFLGLKTGDKIRCSRNNDKEDVWTLYDSPVYNELKQQYKKETEKESRENALCCYVLASALIINDSHRGIEFVRNVLAYNPIKDVEIVLKEPFFMYPDERIMFFNLDRGDKISCADGENPVIRKYITYEKEIKQHKKAVKDRSGK